MIARGVVSTAVSHARGGSVSFAIDDGSGPIRVTISTGSGIATGKIQRGAWLELRGVLGQETTATEPLKGYRLWPRASADLRIIAAPATSAAHAPACCAPVKPPKPHADNGQLEDALQGYIVPAGSVPPPTLTPSPPWECDDRGPGAWRDRARPIGSRAASRAGAGRRAGRSGGAAYTPADLTIHAQTEEIAEALTEISSADAPHTGNRQYHIALERGELAEYILLVGDPGRVAKVSARWESVELNRSNREITTATGTATGTANGTMTSPV